MPISQPRSPLLPPVRQPTERLPRPGAQARHPTRAAPAAAMAALAAALLLGGCGGRGGGGDDARGSAATDGARQGPDTLARGDSAAANGSPALVGVITGLEMPESVLHDPEQDVYFVSVVGGSPGQKDGNGAIARVPADSLERADRGWVRGRAGAPLDAPKGMAIVGDTLWVADIDVVRGYNRRTGRPVGTVALDSLGAVFLNDVAVGADSALYVTDTGIRFNAMGQPDGPPSVSRIYRIAGRKPAVAVDNAILSGPNGIAWDSAGRRFVIAPFSGPTLLAWSLEGGRPPNPRRLAAGPGSYDGVGVLPDGRIAVTSWADSTLYTMRGDSALVPLITGIDGPADFGVDRKRGRLMIPLFNAGRVVVYRLGR